MIWTDDFLKDYMDKMYTDDKPVAHEKRTPVIARFPDGVERRYESMTEAAERTGVNKGQISECCHHGRSRTAGGITWRFDQ